MSNWCHRSSQLGGWACRRQIPCSRSSRDTKSIKNYKEGEKFNWKKNRKKKTFISYDKRLTKAAKRIFLVDFFLKYICEIDMLQSAKNWVKLYKKFFLDTIYKKWQLIFNVKDLVHFFSSKTSCSRCFQKHGWNLPPFPKIKC